MLSVRNIQKSFRMWSGERLTVLDGLSMTVCPGQVVGVTGGNGTGKTTLLRIIAGLETPDEGTVKLDGQDLTAWTYRKRSKVIRLVTQNPFEVLFSDLTVAENLLLADREQPGFLLGRALASGRRDRYIARLSSLFPEIAGKADEPVASLSGGEVQMCALAMTLMSRPKFALLDEFVSSMSDENAEQAAQVLVRLVSGQARGNAPGLVVVSHDKKLLYRLEASIIELRN